MTLRVANTQATSLTPLRTHSARDSEESSRKLAAEESLGVPNSERLDHERRRQPVSATEPSLRLRGSTHTRLTSVAHDSVTTHRKSGYVPPVGPPLGSGVAVFTSRYQGSSRAQSRSTNPLSGNTNLLTASWRTRFSSGASDRAQTDPRSMEEGRNTALDPRHRSGGNATEPVWSSRSAGCDRFLSMEVQLHLIAPETRVGCWFGNGVVAVPGEGRFVEPDQGG